MHPSVLASQPSLTFTDYFKLNIDTDEVVAYFGYTFRSTTIDLPRTTQPIPWYDDLSARLTTSLPYLSLTLIVQLPTIKLPSTLLGGEHQEQ